MAPSLIMFAVAATGSVASTVLVSIVIPFGYSLVNGLFDFFVRQAAKGGTAHPFIIWIKDEEDDILQQRPGTLEKLVTLHRNGRRIAHVERSVRIKEANPYSLGLNLTLGALAVDLAAIVAQAVDSTYLALAIFVHIVVLLIVAATIFYNQTREPNKVKAIRSSAGVSILLGSSSVALALLIILGSG